VTDEFSVSTRGELSGQCPRVQLQRIPHTNHVSNIARPVESRPILIIYNLEAQGREENESGRVEYRVVEHALAGLGRLVTTTYATTDCRTRNAHRFRLATTTDAATDAESAVKGSRRGSSDASAETVAGNISK